MIWWCVGLDMLMTIFTRVFQLVHGDIDMLLIRARFAQSCCSSVWRGGHGVYHMNQWHKQRNIFSVSTILQYCAQQLVKLVWDDAVLVAGDPYERCTRRLEVGEGA